MNRHTIVLPGDGSAIWAGMSDYLLLSPDRSHEIELDYVGEPPHGDSFHTLRIDGHPLPGFAWGCLFAASADSALFAASWMEKLYERKTIVVDLEKLRFHVLPFYIHFLSFQGNGLIDTEKGNDDRYVLPASNRWTQILANHP